MTTTRSASRRWVWLTVVLAGSALAAGSATLLQRDQADGSTDRSAAQAVEVDLRAPARLPALPAAAAQPTVAGATAFTLFWFDTLNYSLANNDADALASYTGVGCQQCSGWLIGISRWKASGGRLDGGLTVPLDLAVGPFEIAEPVSFAATFLTTPATVTRPDLPAQEYPGGRTRGGVTAFWANDRWQVTDIILDVTQAQR